VETVTGLPTLDRQEFLTEYFDYKPGEHVSIFGPTGIGKTHLLNQLMQHTATEKLPAVVLIAKPRDETVQKWNKVLKFGTVHDWPPDFVKRVFNPKAKGWLLWPRHTFDPQRDNKMLSHVFRKGILDSYKRGNRILIVDEAFGVAKELRLGEELVTVWTRGRSMNVGLWAATQKPSHVPLWMYDQATHLFIARDPDRRARERYREIGGGIDPREVERAVTGLKKREFLYIHTDGPTWAKVSE
jgi:hypothetical protein